MSKKPTKADAVYWGSRIGVVLAVAGSAVGLGNFLRFPGQAAQNGAGAFMIPYFIALLLVGIPLAWAEWAMGRHSGVRGFHSAPGIFASICRNRWASLIGSLALLIPLMVYTYYVVIEAWCLGYAWHYLTGSLMKGSDPGAYNTFFDTFTGATGQGDALVFGETNVVVFIAITFVLNFSLILCGLTKGIETFCKIAMPLMIICAIFVLIRVLTLGTPELDTQANLQMFQNVLSDEPDNPERQMWLSMALLQDGQKDQAKKAAETAQRRINDLQGYIDDLTSELDNTEEKLTTAGEEEKEDLNGQIAALDERIATLKKEQSDPNRPDFSSVEEQLAVIIAGQDPEFANQSVAGGLNFMWNPDWEKLKQSRTWLAAAGQIFFSLSVGFGVIINYASYLRRRDDIALSGLTAASTNEFFEVVLGGLITLPAAFIFLGVAAGTFGTFGLGFNALPNVFARMEGGQIFGFLWFFMLFLAAITSSLSMLQPVMSFIEEGLGLSRRGAAILLGLIALGGSSFVVYYSQGLSALDNIDFWCGTFLIVVLATIQSIIYGWVFGADKGDDELRTGALIKIPKIVPFILKYVTPVFLLFILGSTIVQNSGTYVDNFVNDPIARRSVFLILAVLGFLVIAIGIAVTRWTAQGRFDWLNKENEKA